jgi:hypothetical protein
MMPSQTCAVKLPFTHQKCARNPDRCLTTMVPGRFGKPTWRKLRAALGGIGDCSSGNGPARCPIVTVASGDQCQWK